MILLRTAAVLELLVAAANLPLTWMLRFGREHDRLTPIVRQIHQVHHVFVGVLLVAMAAISWLFSLDLISGDGLGRCIAALIALFWGARLGVQRLYYDRGFLRRHRLGDLAFSAIFAVLCTIYAAAAEGALR